MKSLKTNRLFHNYVLLVVNLFLMEILFRLVQKIPILDVALLRIFLSCNIIAIFFAWIFYLTPQIVSKIGICVITFIFAFYGVLQAGFLNFLGVYLSFGTSSQLGAVIQFIKEYLASFYLRYLLIFLPFIGLVIYYILTRKKELQETKENKILASGISLCLIILLSCFYYISLTIKFMANNIQLRTTKELFNNPSIPNIAVNQFGIIIYGGLDIKCTLLGVEAEDEQENFEKPKQEETDNTRHIDDSEWESLQANESNSTLSKLNDYYLSRLITSKNDKTGIFAGKNLIVIMIESGSNAIINEEYFPNIYKLYNEGFSWTNAYSPRNSCSTGNNEMSGMVSLFTINNSCTANRYKNNKYPESIFNLFNRANGNYLTTSYHNFNDTYYFRNVYHPNMGSSKYYDMYKLGIKWNGQYAQWPSDIELFQKAQPLYMNEEQFMSWFITVSPHHPYSNSSYVGDLYMNEFMKIYNNANAARYMSKLKIVDLAIAELLNELEASGKLDDTVIAIYADHYPYGMQTKTYQGYYDYDVTQRREIDRTPLIIWNSKITPEKFDDYTTFMNLTPTIANLFGLDFDPRLYAGEDMFAPEFKGKAIFADGSWQNEVAYYDAGTGKIQYLTDTIYTNEEIVAINKDISNKIKMSNLAIANNYFNYLDTKTNKFKVVPPVVDETEEADLKEE